ncbi:hypothetical protein [Candidatus Nitrososphaera sp. FF02]|uniref:hypothetical protein n=1 Tax=Candidatus Nitrososphaera sp. FF02 TaxID=3398226 RepID=UPI0039E77E1B
MSFAPREGEKVMMTEDCAEDKLRSGVLILTSKRLLFQKTEGRMATFSKKEGEIVLDIPLESISAFKPEGFLVKKFVITVGEKTYKFGVFSNGKWDKLMKQAKAA